MQSAVQPNHLLLGFMTVFAEGSGYVGGYLVTNSWGRPLEFRLSSAVQPNKIQQILYAETLNEYLHADLIGKTLFEKTAAPVQLLFVDSLQLLPLRTRLELPVVAVLSSAEPGVLHPERHLEIERAGSARKLVIEAAHARDRERILELLERLDAGLDVGEPFQRVREAMGEARKMGVGRGTAQAA